MEEVKLKILQQYKINPMKQVQGNLSECWIDNVRLEDLAFPNKNLDTETINMYNTSPSALKVKELIDKFLALHNLPDARIYVDGVDFYIYHDRLKTDEELDAEIKVAQEKGVKKRVGKKNNEELY